MKFEKTGYFTLILILTAALLATPISYAETSSDKTSSDKTSIKEVKQETQDLIQTLKAYSADQRDEAVRKTKAVLDRLDKRIDALETRIDNNWENMNKAARKEARSSLRALRKQRTKVAEWYGSMRSSSADAWEHMKKGFSDAYKALYDAWENSVKEFSTEKEK